MMDILVSCLLSTKIGIIIAQGVQNLAESFVEALARLVHTRSLLVVVLLRVLLLRMCIVLLDDMRQFFSLHVMRHLARYLLMNLTFLNFSLVFLGI